MGTTPAGEVPQQQATGALPLRLLWILPQWCLSIGSRCSRWQAEQAYAVIERVVELWKLPLPSEAEQREAAEYLDRMNRERGH